VYPLCNVSDKTLPSEKAAATAAICSHSSDIRASPHLDVGTEKKATIRGQPGGGDGGKSNRSPDIRATPH